MKGLRLAVIHPDDAARAGVVARFRGAEVLPVGTIPVRDDVVLIAAPDAGLREETEAYLAAGAHVLVAADPCPTADVVESLFRLAQTMGVQFALVNPDRYLPSRQLVRQQVGTTLGEPGLIRIHRWDAPSSTGTTGWPEAIHRDLDVALWLAGRQPDRVFALERTDAGRIVQVHLGFPVGGSALIDYTDRLPAGDGYQSLSVIASAGGAYADDHHNVQLLYRGGRPQAVRTEERARQLAAMAQDFIDSGKADHTLGGEAEWKAVFAVADACRRSIATGQATPPEGH